MGWIPILGIPAGIPINILPLLMGATNVWLMQMTPKTGDAMQRRVLMFMPLIFLVFCYNFAAALALYYTTQNLFTILQLWQNQRQPMPVLEKVAPAPKNVAQRTIMTPKELLDTMLGYLGFVVQIEETQSEGGNPTLQIYTEESHRLIGRDGETLEAIQFLLNRLIQAKDKDAPKVIVDCEHYRSMREDEIVQRVRELAERVRISGRSLAARADEFLRAAHRAQRLQGRSRCRDLEPVRFRADQADHAAEAPAETRTGAAGVVVVASEGCFARLSSRARRRRGPTMEALFSLRATNAAVIEWRLARASKP